MATNGLSGGYTPVIKIIIFGAAPKEILKCHNQVCSDEGHGGEVEVQDRTEEDVGEKSQNSLPIQLNLQN